MDNKVIGSKAKDNKDTKNRQKTTYGVTQMGKIGGHQKGVVLRPQNDRPSTPPQQNPNMGDKGVQVSAKRAKKLNRIGASYSEKATKAAMNARGMM